LAGYITLTIDVKLEALVVFVGNFGFPAFVLTSAFQPSCFSSSSRILKPLCSSFVVKADQLIRAFSAAKDELEKPAKPIVAVAVCGQSRPADTRIFCCKRRA